MSSTVSKKWLLIVMSLLLVLVATPVLSACGGDDDEETPSPTVTTSPTPKPTATPSPTATASPTAKPTTTASPTATATATATPSPTAVKPTGRLVVAITGLGTEVFLDWANGSGTEALDVIYETLVRGQPNSVKVLPALASSWEGSPDRKDWTFRLNRGVQFHNGWGEVTADDVKFSYEKLLAPESQLSLRPNFVAAGFKSVEVKDRYTVVFHLDRPHSDLTASAYRELINGLRVVSKKYIETVGEKEAGKNPVGSGPYKFVSKGADSVTLEAVEDHWRKVPYYKTLVYKVVPDAATQLAMLKAGEVDIVGINFDNIKEIEKAGLKVMEGGSPVNMYALYFSGLYIPGEPGYDPTLPWVGPDPEKALKVRKAMNLAINRKEIIDYVFNGHGQIMTEYHFYPDYYETDVSMVGYPYDPVEAKRLLAEAGYPNGFKFDLIYSDMARMPVQSSVALAAAGYWEKIGLKPNLVPMEFGALFSTYRERKLVGVYTMPSGWRGNVLAAYNMLVPGAATGQGGVFIHEKQAAIIKALQTETDPAKKAQLHRELQKLMHDNYMLVIAATVPTLYGVSKKVGKWPLSGGGAIYDLAYITP